MLVGWQTSELCCLLIAAYITVCCVALCTVYMACFAVYRWTNSKSRPNHESIIHTMYNYTCTLLYNHYVLYVTCIYLTHNNYIHGLLNVLCCNCLSFLLLSSSWGCKSEKHVSQRAEHHRCIHVRTTFWFSGGHVRKLSGDVFILEMRLRQLRLQGKQS